MNVAPAFVFQMIKYQPGFVTDDLQSHSVEQLVGYIMIVQSFFLMFALHVPEGEYYSSKWYHTCMIYITNTFIKIAEFILPWVISLLSIWCMLRLPKVNGGDRLYAGSEYILILVNQLILFAYFYKEFYPKYCECHENQRIWVKTHITMWDRLDYCLENEPVS